MTILKRSPARHRVGRRGILAVLSFYRVDGPAIRGDRDGEDGGAEAGRPDGTRAFDDDDGINSHVATREFLDEALWTFLLADRRLVTDDTGEPEISVELDAGFAQC